MKRNNAKVIIFYVALIAVIFVAVFAMLGDTTTKEKVNFSDIMHYFEEDRVKEFEVSNENVITLVIYKTDKTGVLLPEDVVNLPTEKVSYKLRDVSLFVNAFEKYEGTVQNLVKYEYEPLAEYPWWISFIPSLLTVAAIILFGVFMTKQMNKSSGGMMSFGKAKAHVPQGDKNKVTFADVAGAEEEKEELVEIVEFLKDPEKFAKLGAKIPHGVLLVGPPGTGKTLLAKAVAGEAGVQIGRAHV